MRDIIHDGDMVFEVLVVRVVVEGQCCLALLLLQVGQGMYIIYKMSTYCDVEIRRRRNIKLV